MQLTTINPKNGLKLGNICKLELQLNIWNIMEILKMEQFNLHEQKEFFFFFFGKFFGLIAHSRLFRAYRFGI